MTQKFFLIVAVSLSGFSATMARGEGGAAGALQGAAAIVGAAGQIAAAGIAASADKAVAAINAQANVEMTRIANDAVRDTNKTNETIALAQTYAAANIAAINNAGATERQGMISTESILATKEKYESMREKAWMEYEYNVAKLLMEDKARQQQLQLEKEGRELVEMTKLLRPAGANGGLEITRFNDSLELNPADVAAQESTTNNLAQAGTAEPTAQERLTRAVASTAPSMAQRLASFRGSRGASAQLPQMLLASGNLKRNTPKVRGSFSTKLLAIQEPATTTASINPVALRAARRASLDGVPHNPNLGSRNTAPTHGGGESEGGGGGHHNHSH